MGFVRTQDAPQVAHKIFED